MRVCRLGKFGLLASLLVWTIPANAEGCKLDGLKLDCGKKDAAIFAALSSQETASFFNSSEQALDSFERPSDLEVYRKSVESNWRAVNRVERRERNKMRRRKISASEFAEWSEQYTNALRNYRSAMGFYRTLVWHGKTGKPAPSDD